jgi:hypothetical protein
MAPAWLFAADAARRARLLSCDCNILRQIALYCCTINKLAGTAEFAGYLPDYRRTIAGQL